MALSTAFYFLLRDNEHTIRGSNAKQIITDAVCKHKYFFCDICLELQKPTQRNANQSDSFSKSAAHCAKLDSNTKRSSVDWRAEFKLSKGARQGGEKYNILPIVILQHVILSKLCHFPSFGGGVGGRDGLHKCMNFLRVNF